MDADLFELLFSDDAENLAKVKLFKLSCVFK